MRKAQKALLVGLLAAVAVGGTGTPAMAVSQANTLSTPYGSLTSNVWRQTGNGTISGNTRQWEYQVSAVYSGSYSVERIRTTWWASANLRNSASLSLGVSTGGVEYSKSTSWNRVTTPQKYWENQNGAKSSSYRSNIVEGPSSDYLSDSITTTNQALLKIRGDARIFTYNAGV